MYNHITDFTNYSYFSLVENSLDHSSILITMTFHPCKVKITVFYKNVTSGID